MFIWFKNHVFEKKSFFGNLLLVKHFQHSNFYCYLLNKICDA